MNGSDEIRLVTFTLKLHHDESTAEKLKFMSPWDVVWDDARNPIPEEYWKIVDLQPGESIRVTVERIKEK